jgi:hypothetical protein
MHLFVIDISFASTQKFESLNLGTRVFYSITKPLAVYTGRLKQEIRGKSGRAECLDWPVPAQIRGRRAGGLGFQMARRGPLLGRHARAGRMRLLDPDPTAQIQPYRLATEERQGRPKPAAL